METQLFQNLRIGDTAPDFEALTTVGNIKFSEYNKDHWIILFSHPADFTPVCTTEMIGFAKEKEFFEFHNTRLLGLSIDSIHAHIAWLNSVHEKIGVLIDFPIVSDISMHIATKYGMQPSIANTTETIRSVFIIDPKGVIRLIINYPINVGRSLDEIKRTLLALHTSEEYNCSTPLDWQPGDMVIVPAPKTLNDLAERKNSSLDMIDWYLAKKNIDIKQ